MRIEITYKRHADPVPHTLVLEPEEYFDPLESNESFEKHGIPKHDHAIDYLPCNSEEIEWTSIQVAEIPNSYSIRTEYYRNGSMMWHRKETTGYEEICVQTNISKQECHIVRLHKNYAAASWQVNYSGKIMGLPGQPQKEEKYIDSDKHFPL
ncbi:MAG TPA: hypothetical protein VEF04_06030 [Blastocatellia bacterium]|nr:hypothetical protein [Blastocatellia bacterium]